MSLTPNFFAAEAGSSVSAAVKAVLNKLKKFILQTKTSSQRRSSSLSSVTSSFVTPNLPRIYCLRLS